MAPQVSSVYQRVELELVHIRKPAMLNLPGVGDKMMRLRAVLLIVVLPNKEC